MNELLRAIADHLTYYGYRVGQAEAAEAPPGTLNAQHDWRPMFWIIPTVGGAFFRALFALRPIGPSEEVGFLSFLNDANAMCFAGHFYRMENALAAAAWYFGTHERDRFDLFFQQYLTDMSVPAQMWPDRANLYLGTTPIDEPHG